MPCSVVESVPADVESCRALIGDEPCAVSGLRWDRWCSSSSRQGRLRALFRGGSRAGASARRLRHRAFAMGWRSTHRVGPVATHQFICAFRQEACHHEIRRWCDRYGCAKPVPDRRVRNPIYVALLIILLGEALLFGDERVAARGVLFWLFTFAVVVIYEEPTLRQQFIL